MRITFFQIFALSKITVKENLRNRAFFVLVFAGMLLYFFSAILGMMAVGDTSRVILDGGFWILGIFGLISSLFFGLNIIQAEVKRKIIYMMISRPMSRTNYILGKFFGIFIIMLLLYLVLSGIFILLLSLTHTPISGKFFIVLISIFLEWSVMAGFSLFFAVFTSPFLHGIFLTAIYFIGHWTKYLYAYAQNTQELSLKYILTGLYTLFPNLEALNYRTLVIYEQAVDSSLLVQSLLTGSGWIVAGIVGAVFIFNQKKLD
ncbi:MAG: ABC transporter permease [Desulfobacter sp.]|nr:ABC transporter permease [Desulfobacter sp.]WDP86598.1 MAG: ABC transporter permease [Desulfobacter sp.]